MSLQTATYEVLLYLRGVLVGDVRKIAQNLQYARRRTKVGVDSIDFTMNDVLFNEWCVDRELSINDLLKPMALECRIVRDGVTLVGGFLATMPAYNPLQTSADLNLHFDGFLNLLGGVYIRNTSNNLPLGTITGRANALVTQMITLANTISSGAGNGYGFVAGHADSLASITHTFDNYKTVKDWICDRCDNTTGAGPFDVYFHADKTYDIYADDNFGDVITDWVAFYPMLLNNTSVASISAAEVGDFTSSVIALGAGEVSANAQENTAVLQTYRYPYAITEYGYYETLYQDSSISTASVLLRNAQVEAWNRGEPIWQPQITLKGIQVAPTPSGSNKIWVGDTITISNSEDLTGMTNGDFRVNELAVAVSATGDETITPVLERV